MRVYNTFNWAANEDKTVETIMKFETYYEPNKTDVTYNQYVFYEENRRMMSALMTMKYIFK